MYSDDTAFGTVWESGACGYGGGISGKFTQNSPAGRYGSYQFKSEPPDAGSYFPQLFGYKEKAFYLIGNYDAESELTRGAIIKEYHIPGSRLGIIPHNVQFADAVSAGELIPFLLRNYHCEEESCNYEFMASAREAALLFQKAAEQVDRWE